jgi:NAD(P)-dependent dehydrogenase (short-subunit alcohol dehydrogenase family)
VAAGCALDYLAAMACIVVSGASGEFGPTLVRFLIRRGDKVGAFGSPRSAERLRAVQAELGSNCLAIPMDATSPPDWKSALERVEQLLGAPSGAALLAGGYQGGPPFHESDDAIWDRMISVNLETARRGMQALLPGMVRRGAGSIVVIGSQVVERPWKGAGAAAYTAAKSAVVALARAVAAEVSSKGIRVNAVMPSAIDTAANRAAMPKADPKRWVSPESLAETIAFLLSDAARDISGAALPIYGQSG